MATILEKQVKISRILTTSMDQARAIEDPARAKILQILYHKELTAEMISKELKKNGYDKALTTIRHHLDILKEAGLIEIVKIQESRGAITKFYSTSTKLLGFEIPDNFESIYSSVIKTATTKIEKLLKNIGPKTVTKGKKQKSPVRDVGYDQYVLMEIVNRAMTNVLENSNPLQKK